jgi:hypothetical protein
MNPAKVVRENVAQLTDLPNVGPATAADLRLLGIDVPENLKGRDPYELYDRLCTITRTRQDPCVLDVLISITRFMDGGEPKPWWVFTQERKRALRK